MYWLSVCAILSLLRISQAASQSPIVITPSGRWEGLDGPWSTFDFEIGTPAQKVSLHPAISLSEIWLWNSTSCVGSEPCGSTFSAVKSSTWRNWNISRQYGEYSNGLDYLSEPVPFDGRVYNGVLGDDCAEPFYDMAYTGFTSHGRDVGSLPIRESTLQKIRGPVVAGLLATQQRPSLGLLGLSAPIRCQNSRDVLSPSFLDVIEEETTKRKLTWLWSYTAGRYNGGVRSTNASLIFGGYDTSRFHNETLMRGNQSEWIDDESLNKNSWKPKIAVQILGMDLLIDGNSTHTQNTTWVSAPQITLDSTRPTTILPLNFCRVFLEHDFKLTRNNVSGFYLIDEDNHNRLLKKNPTIRFNITTYKNFYNTTTWKQYDRNSSYTSSVNFDFTYKKMLLNYTAAPGEPSSYYIPITCSNDTTALVLGREFMQKAYLMVTSDEEYYLAKATADPTAASVPVALRFGEKIIMVPLSKETVLSKAVVVGIVIAAISGAVLMILSGLWMLRTRKEKVGKSLT